MPDEKLADRPTGWGEDPLSHFLDVARHNLFATFDSSRPQYKRISEIDQAFRAFLDHMDNPTGGALPAFLALRSHAAYLGAARLALAGETVEAYMVLRGCVEAAPYAHFMVGNAERMRIWRERDHGEDQRKLLRKTFEVKKMLDSVRQKVPHAHEAAQRLYDFTIDQGAHPNPAAVFANMKIIKGETHYQFEQLYLVGDGPMLRACLRATMLAGTCALFIFGAMYPDRFKAAGLDEEMSALIQGL